MARTTFLAQPDGEEPARAAIFPAPRSFFWLPLDGHRHAAEIRDRETLGGELIGTLCGQQLVRTRAGDTEWLWPTCQNCWNATAVRVGLRRE